MGKKEDDLFPVPNQAAASQQNTKSRSAATARKGNPIAILIAVIGLVVLAIFVVRPAVLGYGIYQQADASNLSVQEYSRNMEELTRNLEVTKANLSSYASFTGALITQVDEKADELIDCRVQLERIQLDVERAQQEIADKDAEVTAVKSETQDTIDQQVADKTKTLEEAKTACETSLADNEKKVGEVQAKYDQLVKNTAKSVCCKVKVDNPQINFYDVVDNKITCLEQGTNQLNC